MRQLTAIIFTPILLLLAGCTTDDRINRQDEGLTPVKLTASHGNDITIESSKTRASNGLYSATTGFTGGETVKVYLNSTSTSSDYTVGEPNGSHVSELSGGLLYYPPTGAINLFAVYPSTSSASHTVAYDQTSDPNYKASDLMYAKAAVDQESKSSPQNLTFSHQLVKLKLNIIKGAGITSVTEVKMNNVKRTVSVSPSISSAGIGSATSTGDANGDNILIFSGTNTSSSAQTYACVFPAQAWSNTNFISVTADTKTVTYKLDRASWTPGSEYELTLNVNAVALGTTISITGWNDTNPNVVVNPTVTEPYVLMPLSAVTSNHVGWIITSDGDVVNTAAAATYFCKTSVAMIAYVGEAGTADTSNGTYKGLAISLNDIGNKINWCEQTSAFCQTSQYTTISDALTDKGGISQTTTYVTNASGHTHPVVTAIAGYRTSTTHPSGTSDWFLPSMGQWNLMVKALVTKAGKTAVNLSEGDNAIMKNNTFDSLFTQAGATGLDHGYFSCTEQNEAFIWLYSSSMGKAFVARKNDSAYLRLIIAF